MKKIVRIGAIALIAFAAIGVMSCDWLISAVVMGVNGKAVNVLAEVTTTDEYWKGESSSGTAVTLQGATITFTSLKEGDSTTYSTSVGSDGTWYLSGVNAGKYRITGSATGWTFIPMDIEISGFMSEVTTDVLAYPTPSGDPLMVIVRWTNELVDIDSHMIIDTDTDLTAYADHVYFNKTSNTLPAADTVMLDRDVKYPLSTSTSLNGYPVETIRVTQNPFGSGSTGQLRYYLQSYSYYNGTSQVTTNTTLTGDPTATYTGDADATVYVMLGTEHYGTWTMPIDTAEKTLGILKIDVSGTSTATNYVIKSFGNEGDAPKAIGSVSLSPVVVDEIR